MSIISCKFCGNDTQHTVSYHFVRQHEQDYFLLMFFKTPFVYKKDGRFIKGEKQHYLINPPYGESEHKSADGEKEGFINDWIFFKGKDVNNIIKKFRLPVSEPFYIDDYSIIAPYINKISTEMIFKHTAYEYKISAIVADMLINLGRQFELSGKKNHPAFTGINNARNYMFNNIENKITIKDLACRSNYSESRFCVLYNMFFSSTPIDDLLNARIEKAAALLEYSNLSVTEIAKACGFSSVHYFSRKFKERTGISPSNYIKL